MNSITNTILVLLLGWLRTLLNVARDFISSDSSTVWFTFFRNNWKIIFLILCVGGFVLDKLVYLIRWRPQPIWLRRRIRHKPLSRPQQDYNSGYYDEASGQNSTAYTPPDDYPSEDTYNQAAYTDVYTPEVNYPDSVYPPTVQYQIQSGQYTEETRRVPLPYTTPHFAPEASQSDYHEAETPPHWDEASKGHTFAPAADSHQFAFGMAPSFGSAQSEPTYHYPQTTPLDFAPPQAPPDYYDEQAYAQPAAPKPLLYKDVPAPPPESQEATPYFRPFSDRDETSFAPPKSTKLGSVARKARSLFGAEEAYQDLRYQDLQPSVDVSKAFHSPVYPKQKPEGDA